MLRTLPKETEAAREDNSEDPMEEPAKMDRRAQIDIRRPRSNSDMIVHQARLEGPVLRSRARCNWFRRLDRGLNFFRRADTLLLWSSFAGTLTRGT